MSAVTSGFYVTGGTLRSDAPSYVERQADADLLAALRAGEYCYVLNSRQMGKSSLCVRTIAHLRDEAVRTVFLDLTKFGSRNLTAEQWYAALLAELGRELGLRAECLQYWKEHPELPAVQRLFGAITEVALKAGVRRQTSGVSPDGGTPVAAGVLPGPLGTDAWRLTPDACPLVIFVDEIDVTRSLPFSTDEFFAAIRQCYVGRATEPALQRVTFCLLGTATPAELIEDTRVSPFNIGRRIEVRDFTPEEAAPLAGGLAGEGASKALLERILYWTGGHPYLTQRLCRAVAEARSATPSPRYPVTPSAAVDRLCEALFLTHTAKEGDDNLSLVRSRLLKSEADLASLLELYGKMRVGQGVADDETNALCGVLKLSGVAKVEGGRLLVRNRIYGEVFDRGWVAQHMPDAEVRRQRAAYRRGMIRAVMASAAALTVVTVLAVLAWLSALSAGRERDKANIARMAETKQRTEKEALLYASDMLVAHQALTAGVLGRARELLYRHRPPPGEKGRWEWRLLSQLCRGDESASVNGRSAAVQCIAISPDGRLLAAGGSDNVIKLYSVAGWEKASSHPPREIAILRGHKGRVYKVAFAPDGKVLASASADGVVRLWDISAPTSAQPRLAGTLALHEGSIWSLAFAPRGPTLISGDDRTLHLWNWRTRTEIASCEIGNYINDARFSPDGKLVATGDGDRRVRLWRIDLSSAEPLKEIPLKSLPGEDPSQVWPVAFSPDGRSLVAGHFGGEITVWNVLTGRQSGRFRAHSATVSSIKYSPDGRMLATSSLDSTVKLWRASSFRAIRTFRGHLGPIFDSQWLPDGKHVATASSDGTVRLWSTVAASQGPVTRRAMGAFMSPFVSADGRRSAAVSGQELRVWDAASGKVVKTLRTSAIPILEVTISPADSNVLATCDKKGSVRLWNLTSGQQRLLFRKRFAYFTTSIAFSPDGKLLAAGTYDGAVSIWDLAEKRERIPLAGHNGPVIGVAFSPDGQILAASHDTGVVEAWDATSRQPLFAPIATHRVECVALAFSPDSRTLATGGWDGMVHLWEMPSGRLLHTLQMPLVNALAFARDGRSMAVGGEGFLRLWDTASQQEVFVLADDRFRVVQHIRYAPDGTLWIGGDGSNLWRIRADPSTPLSVRTAAPPSAG